MRNKSGVHSYCVEKGFLLEELQNYNPSDSLWRAYKKCNYKVKQTASFLSSDVTRFFFSVFLIKRQQNPKVIPNIMHKAAADWTIAKSGSASAAQTSTQTVRVAGSTALHKSNVSSRENKFYRPVFSPEKEGGYFCPHQPNILQ